MRRLKILHCPISTGGNAAHLSNEEKRRGADSVSLALNQTKFDKTSDLVVKAGHPLIAYLSGLYYFLKAIFRYDVIHYYSGQTLVPGRVTYNPLKHKSPRGLYLIYNFLFYYLEMIDIRILKRIGKKIIVTFTGREARLYEHAVRNEGNFLSPDLLARCDYDSASDILKKRRIAIFAEYADLMLAVNPDLMMSLPPSAKFMPYPIAIASPDRTPANDAGPIRFLHAPTNRDIKGTKYILDASRELAGEGYRHELLIMEGKNHSEVDAMIQSADIVIDQLMIGWYGGLAVEAMCCRKAVVAHINAADLAYIPGEMARDLPVIPASPDTIKDVMKKIIVRGRQPCREAGRESFHFAIKWHAPSRIALKVARDAGYAHHLMSPPYRVENHKR